MPTPPPSSDWPRRLLGVTTRIEDGVLVGMLAAMIALSGGQILLRNLFATGFEWGDPLLRVMVMWLGLLGAMVATRDDNHITIDMLSRFLPPRAKAASRLITDLFTAGICALLAYHGGRFVLLDMDAGTRAFAFVPTWVCELIIPFAFAVMTLRFCLLFALQARILARREPETEP